MISSHVWDCINYVFHQIINRDVSLDNDSIDHVIIAMLWDAEDCQRECWNHNICCGNFGVLITLTVQMYTFIKPDMCSTRYTSCSISPHFLWVTENKKPKKKMMVISTPRNQKLHTVDNFNNFNNLSFRNVYKKNITKLHLSVIFQQTLIC